MNRDERINRINAVLADYFSEHKGARVPAKDMMDRFVSAGIFTSNSRDGLPIRRLLRELDDENRLHLIPFLSVERKTANRNWYFTAADTTHGTDSGDEIQPQAHEKVTRPNNKRDEGYVIDLCDKVLRLKARRQHSFDFLRGDTGRTLPVDAYYEELNLVIEYRERQHTESVGLWNRMTVSGIPRDEQRRRYDQRRRDLMPEHGIRLVEISYSDFPHNARKRLLRRADADEQAVRNILHEKGLA